MKNNFVLLAWLVVASCAASDPRGWAQFKAKFDKIYDSLQEEQYRRDIFLDNLKQMEEHNARFEQGLTTFSMGINQFSDMTDAEAVEYTCSYVPRTDYESSNTNEIPYVPSGEPTAVEVDWRTEGAVTPVKYQGKHCTSGWAFSATGALEAFHFIKTGNLVALSEQNLIDCSKSNHGCNGGSAEKAFEYIIQNKGIDTEKSYPYIANDRECRFNPNTVGATMNGYEFIYRGSENIVMEVVGLDGPVATGIHVMPSFLRYKGGVYYNRECNATDLNHFVLVVGYGTNGNEGDYWIVKNSWYTSWGLDGYALMARNRNNNCGIATRALIPHNHFK